jgi:heme/copper-type cytochrome/quinol oxidase subunit 4
MKNKTVFLSLLVTSVIIIAVLIVAKIYYAAIAVFIAWLIINYREIWSLIRHRKLLPVDERMRESMSKALRNSFIFFGLVAIFTIFTYATVPQDLLRPDLEIYLAVLLAFAGILYMLSYLYYDRIEAHLSSKESGFLKATLPAGGIAFLIFFFNTFYAGSIYPSMEWLAFHRIMLIGSALIFAIAIVGNLTIFLKTLISKPKYLSS